MSDNQLVDTLENLLLAPDSDFYLSKIFFNPDGSALDPRTIDQADLGTFHIDALNLDIGIVVKSLTVRGLSNVQIKFDGQDEPEIDVEGSVVTFHAKQPNTQEGYERPSQVPNQIEAKGDLYVTLGGEQMPPGTFNLTISSIDEIQGAFSAVEEVDGQLASAKVTFTGFSASPQIGNGNIKIEVNLDTAFKDTINYVLNQDDQQKQIMGKVNGALSSPDILNSLSDIATQEARKALANI